MKDIKTLIIESQESEEEKRYDVTYYPFLGDDDDEADGEWKEKYFDSLDEATEFYKSLKLWKDVRFKTLYDNQEKRVIAQRS